MSKGVCGDRCGDGSWFQHSPGAVTDPNHWTTGIVPGTNDLAVLGATNSGDLNAVASIGVGDVVQTRFYIGNHSIASGVLNISGGTLDSANSTREGELRVGRGNTPNVSQINQTGGAVNVDGFVHVNSGNSQVSDEYNISGGSLNVFDGPLGDGLFINGNGGSAGGILNVGGTGPSSIDFATYIQDPNSTLIAGLDSGVGGITPINVSNDATVAGTLDVELLGGFNPNLGQMFTVLTAQGTLDMTGLSLDAGDTAAFSLSQVGQSLILTALVGQSSLCDFDGGGCGLSDINLLMAQGDLVTGVSVSSGNQFDLDNDNDIDENDITEWLSLTGTENGYSSPMLRGDTDDLGTMFDPNTPNRTVDITDFQNFLDGFTGIGSTWEVGNFNGDNVVDITDFSNHFLAGFAAASGGSYGAGQSVPEPNTVLLLGLGGLLLGYLCRRRTRTV